MSQHETLRPGSFNAAFVRGNVTLPNRIAMGKNIIRTGRILLVSDVDESLNTTAAFQACIRRYVAAGEAYFVSIPVVVNGMKAECRTMTWNLRNPTHEIPVVVCAKRSKCIVALHDFDLKPSRNVKDDQAAYVELRLRQRRR